METGFPTLRRIERSDPRWQEVILLAAGQIGIVDNRTDDVSAYIESLLKMDIEKADDEGGGDDGKNEPKRSRPKADAAAARA